MTHHSTCSAGTWLCALLLGLSVPLDMSHSPKPYLQLLVVVIFAATNPYSSLHHEHSDPGSDMVRGCMRYGCVSLLCPAPWTEHMSTARCFLKPLVWQGPLASLRIKSSRPCPCCSFSGGLYTHAPASK